MGWLDVLILAALAAAVFFAVRAVRRGKTGCCGSCEQRSRSCSQRRP